MLGQAEKLLQKVEPTTANTNEKLSESRAFVKPTSYILKAVDSATLLFKLSKVHSLYVNHLEDLGIKKLVNKTRLKVNLLEHSSEAHEQHDGKTLLLFSKKG